MVTRTIIVMLCFITLSGLGKAQQLNSTDKDWNYMDYWNYMDNRRDSGLCDSEDVDDAITGFLQYLSFQERNILWEKYESIVLEYVVFVHLSPDYQVDSISIEAVGQSRDENLDWPTSIAAGLSQRLSEWPACDIPVQFPNESWTILLPYSYYTLSMPSKERHTRTSSQNLKNIISSYASNNLSVVFPICVSGWGIGH